MLWYLHIHTGEGNAGQRCLKFLSPSLFLKYPFFRQKCLHLGKMHLEMYNIRWLCHKAKLRNSILEFQHLAFFCFNSILHYLRFYIRKPLKAGNTHWFTNHSKSLLTHFFKLYKVLLKGIPMRLCKQNRSPGFLPWNIAQMSMHSDFVVDVCKCCERLHCILF